MGSILSELLIYVATFWIASDALCLLALRWVPAVTRDDRRELFLLTRGLGPLTISWLLFQLFLFLPFLPAYAYIAVVLGCFAGVIAAGWRQGPHLAEIYRELWRGLPACWPHTGVGKLVLLLIAVLASAVVFVGVGFPIVDADALGFTMEAKLIYRDLGFVHYPTFIADPVTGYYYDTWQVPCLQMLYVWFFLLSGTSQTDVLVRTVAPTYALYTAGIVAWVLFRRTRQIETALWGALALLAVPVFFVHSYLNTQDPHRVYFAFCALAGLATLLRAPSIANAALLGVFTGFTLYAHFFGVVTAAVVAMLYVLLARGPLRARAATLVVVGAVAAPLSGFDYFSVDLRSWQESPVATAPVSVEATPPVGIEATAPVSLPDVGQGRRAAHQFSVTTEDLAANARDNTWLLDRRGQGGDVNRLVFGRLSPFTAVEWFGLFFWLLAAALIVWALRGGKTVLEKIMAATALIYTFVVLSGVRKLSWSNPRYSGTIAPVAAYFIAWGVWALARAGGRDRARRWAGVLLLLTLLLAPLTAAIAFRGAKVGITNPGDLYAKIRSTGWIRDFLAAPRASAESAWTRYFGIKQTVRYALADDHEKLLHSHDYFAAIDYMNSVSPAAATALVVGRETYYFYYAQRRGASLKDPALRGFFTRTNPHAACVLLMTQGIDHVLLDSYHRVNPLYVRTTLSTILEDSRLSSPVYEYGTAKVYQLLCNPPQCEQQCGCVQMSPAGDAG